VSRKASDVSQIPTLTHSSSSSSSSTATTKPHVRGSKAYRTSRLGRLSLVAPPLPHTAGRLPLKRLLSMRRRESCGRAPGDPQLAGMDPSSWLSLRYLEQGWQGGGGAGLRGSKQSQGRGREGRREKGN
jgi:hypothetical protein